MTKKQYMTAGRMGVPVIVGDTRYERIVEVVCTFTHSEDRDRIHRDVPREIVHLRMIDKTGRCNNALPERVQVDPEIKALYPKLFGDDAEDGDGTD